ncbi:16189_t:CDS:2 [Funneliformis geosporum]|nr:16189_t:CDS:2 [Funneliformis geosporum]
MSTITTKSENLEPEEIEVYDPDYFSFNPSWNLLSFLIYRQRFSDSWFNKKDEHVRYTRKLQIIINKKQIHEWMSLRNDSLLDGVKPPTLPDYDQEVMIYGSWWFCPDYSFIVASSKKRKVTSIIEREALVEILKKNMPTMLHP